MTGCYAEKCTGSNAGREGESVEYTVNEGTEPAGTQSRNLGEGDFSVTTAVVVCGQLRN